MELLITDFNEPVMEMRHIDDIQSMKFTKERIMLPCHILSSRQDGYILPMLSTSLDSIADILQNKHPLMTNTGKIYNSYYYNHLQLISIRSPFISASRVPKKKLMLERLSNYDIMASKVGGIRLPKTPNMLHGKNFIYDMTPVVSYLKRMPKLNQAPMLMKIRVYFDAIQKTYEYINGIQGYQDVAPIYIDMDQYEGQSDLLDYHFFTYLLLLLRKPANVLESFKSNYKVFFFTKKGYLLFDMNEDLKRESYNTLVMNMKRLKPEIDSASVVSKANEKDVATAISNKLGFTGDDVGDTIDSDYFEDTEEKKEDESSKPSEDLIDPKSKLVKRAAAMLADDDSATSEEVVDTLIDQANDPDSDAELKKELANIVIQKEINGATTKTISARDKLLREKQQDIKIKGKTLAELTSDRPVPKIKQTKTNATSLNEDMKMVKFANFDETYDSEVLSSDIAEAFASLTDNKTIGMSIIDVKVENTSTVLDMKDTYTVTLEDEYRRRHTIKVNVPRTIDGTFLYLNGSKKMIENQFTGLPVIKTGPSTVQICTNYNKVFIELRGKRFNPNIERFKKWIENPENGVEISRGNNLEENKGYLTTLEYDELAKSYSNITIGQCHYIFNVPVLMDATGHKYESTLTKQLIGYKGSKKEPLYYDTENEDHLDLISAIILEAKPSEYEEFKKISAGKKYIHTEAKILEYFIPTVIILSFFEGITTVIRKFNDKNVVFTDKKSNRDNYMYIPFADGYLSYPMSDTRACIMFNGWLNLPTNQYTVADLDERQTYIDIFETLVGDGYIAGGLINFYDFMIDPITLQILETLQYPTDLVSLFIYANDLLADSQFRSDIDLNMYRLRRNEIIPAILYKQLSIAYAKYRATANNAHPVKMSVDPDCIIKALQGLPTVNNHDDFGPMEEVKQRSLASMKGYAGMNLDDAYKMDKRAFDDSMIGVVGISTDNAKNCGKERHLVLEPNITNARGMIQITDIDKIDNLNEVQLETGVELLNPGGVLHDDPVRTAMATKQRGHAIPTRDQSPLLISTGMDSTIQYRTSDSYSVVAKQDGVVQDVDPVLNIMTIKYKDGAVKAIDLQVRMGKNGGGGMYLLNKLSTSYKKGDKFKEGAILAFDKSYYKDNPYFGNRLTFGTLCKTAIMSNSATYEDSAFVTKQLSKRMASEITMCKTIVIGKNSSIDFIVKVGQEIKVGDELLRFESSYDDAEMNKLLANIRDDLHEAIISLGKTRIVSKYEGRVDDIICYPAVPVEEMSQSLGKVVKELQKNDINRGKYLDKLDPDNKGAAYRAGCLMTRPAGVVQPDQYGKIKGENAEDSVILEFYVTYLDELSDGDKLTHMTANKATIGDVIPEGFEPYSLSRPYEEISTLQPPSAILQRGTPSIRATMVHYKGLIELKRKQYEILTGESWNEKQRLDNPYMDKQRVTNVSETAYSVPEDINSEKVQFMENVFDLQKAELGYYKACRIYEEGEVIAKGIPQMEATIEMIIPGLAHTERPNAKIQNDMLIATSLIYPGVPFCIQFTGIYYTSVTNL